MTENSEDELFSYGSKHPNYITISRFLKNFISYLPLLTLFILLVSLLRLQAYYTFWGVNILDYMDFSELFSPLLNDLVSFFTFILIFITGFLIGKLFLKKSKLRSRYYLLPKVYRFLNIDDNTDAILRIENTIKIVLGLLIMSAVFIFCFALTKISNGYMNLDLISPKLFLYCFIPIVIITLIADTLDYKVHFTHFIIMSMGIIFLINSVVEGAQLANKFYDCNELHNTFIEFTDRDSVCVNSQRYVIGLTSENVILWNKEKMYSEIKNRSDVVRIYPKILPLSNTAKFYRYLDKHEKD